MVSASASVLPRPIASLRMRAFTMREILRAVSGSGAMVPPLSIGRNTGCPGYKPATATHRSRASQAVRMSSHGTTMVTASVCYPFEVGSVTTRPRSSIFTKPAPSSCWAQSKPTSSERCRPSRPPPAKTSGFHRSVGTRGRSETRCQNLNGCPEVMSYQQKPQIAGRIFVLRAHSSLRDKYISE